MDVKARIRLSYAVIHTYMFIRQQILVDRSDKSLRIWAFDFILMYTIKNMSRFASAIEHEIIIYRMKFP